MDMDRELEELKGEVDFDFFDDSPNAAKLRSPSPRSTKPSNVRSKPPHAPKSPMPDTFVNNTQSNFLNKELDTENTVVSRSGAKDDEYSSDSETSESDSGDSSSSYSDISTVRSGRQSRNDGILRSDSSSRSRSHSPKDTPLPKSRSEASAHSKVKPTKSKPDSWSSDSDSETSSGSQTPGSASRTVNDRSPEISKSNVYHSEINSENRFKRPFSAHPRRRQNGVKVSALNNMHVDNRREDYHTSESHPSDRNGSDKRVRKNDKPKKQNPQNAKHDDKESISSDSDMTDVSPLASPPDSPRRTINKSRSADSIDISSRGKMVQYREIPESAGYIGRREQPETLDLNILMKAVSELEKKKRVKDNTRRVMFAAPGKPQDRGNYTFTSDRTTIIELENQRLLREIMKHVAEQREPQRVRPVETISTRRVTSSSINRRKQQRKIEGENMQLLHRLQGIQPSRGMSRTEQLTKYKNTTLFGVPIGVDEELRSMAGSRRSRPGSATSQRSRSLNSIRSMSTSMSSVRSGRSSASRPGSAKKYQADLRPDWSDRW